MKRQYQVCTRCIMDTTDVEISFDDDGVCNHCTAALARMASQLPPAEEREARLARLVETIKAEGRSRQYDCIIGVSGGADSTTTAYWVKKLGLRPLAVHFDNGWDSELAVDNIKKTLDALGIDLYTYVVDWEEFRDLQLSFLKASVANCEIPTDHGIDALLFRVAHRERVRFILSGSNLIGEAIMPMSWAYYCQDLKHLKAVHRRFGARPLKTMPTISVPGYLYYVLVKRIRQIPFLNHIDYDKDEAKKMLARELGWTDYGGKHYESVWTRFYQGYYLPVKFNYDKRRGHYSTLICAGQMTREAALLKMAEPTYESSLLRQDTEYVLKKFQLSEGAFADILKAAPRAHTEFPNHYFLFHRLQRYKNIFRRIATSA